MLHHNDIFQSLSLERKNIVLSPADKKPNIMSKPSNFSIDHILNSAGAPTDKRASVGRRSSNDKNTQNGCVNDTHDCYIMDDNVHPPILNWLQYSQYKSPRLRRKRNNYFSTEIECSQTKTLVYKD